MDGLQSLQGRCLWEERHFILRQKHEGKRWVLRGHWGEPPNRGASKQPYIDNNSEDTGEPLPKSPNC